MTEVCTLKPILNQQQQIPVLFPSASVGASRSNRYLTQQNMISLVQANTIDVDGEIKHLAGSLGL